MNKIITVPSGKHTKSYGKSPFLMGKSILLMAIFNGYVKLLEGTICFGHIFWGIFPYIALNNSPKQ